MDSGGKTMLRLVTCAALLCVICTVGFAQQTAGSTDAATCTFQDGNQLSVRYNAGGKNGLPEGKLWPADSAPMFLFTPVKLLIGSSEIPAGAYSMYVIPNKHSWTLILNKNVSPGSKYDEHQDLVRAEMQVGQLSERNKQFTVVFGHIAPKRCSMRMYYSNTGAWTEFKEQ
jgi:Protein of unknown function (DUF2911)